MNALPFERSMTVVWSLEQLREANQSARLLHGDQAIDEDGRVVGDPPATKTLGFRWSAVNNLFLLPGDLAADEWRASRAADEDNAEREMRQFVWCLPAALSEWQDTPLEEHQLAARMISLPKGIVPSTAERLTAAVDLGKHMAHWILVAWSPGATCHIVDYGRLEIASSELGVEKAILLALREFRDVVSEGWPVGSADGDPKSPDQVWIDSGCQAPVVYAFCREAKGPFMPAVGRGAAQHDVKCYNRPTKTSTTVKSIGEEFHCNWLRDQQLRLAFVNADYWKSWVHQRLSTPLGKAGAMTLYQASPEEHLSLAKHLTAEQKVTQFVAGKGVVDKWERVRKYNHWFDALYNACAAGRHSGVRLVEEAVQQLRERPSLADLARQAREGAR